MKRFWKYVVLILMAGCITGCADQLIIESDPADATVADETNGTEMVIDTKEFIFADEKRLLDAYLAEMVGQAGSLFLSEAHNLGDEICIHSFAEIPEFKWYKMSERELTGELNYFCMVEETPKLMYPSYLVMHWIEGNFAHETLYEQIYFPYMRDSELRDKDRESIYRERISSEETEVSLKITFQQLQLPSEELEKRMSNQMWKDLLSQIMLSELETSDGLTGCWSGDIYVENLEDNMPDKKDNYVNFWICQTGKEPYKVCGKYISPATSTFIYRYERVVDGSSLSKEMKGEFLEGYRINLEYQFPERLKEQSEERLSGFVSMTEYMDDESDLIHIPGAKVQEMLLSSLVGQCGSIISGNLQTGKTGNYFVNGEILSVEANRKAWETQIIPYALKLNFAEGEQEKTIYVPEIQWKENCIGYEDLYDYFIFSEQHEAQVNESENEDTILQIRAKIQVKPSANTKPMDEKEEYLIRRAWSDILMQAISLHLKDQSLLNGVWECELTMTNMPSLENNGDCQFIIGEDGKEQLVTGYYEAWRRRYTFSYADTESMTNNVFDSSEVKINVEYELIAN